MPIMFGANKLYDLNSGPILALSHNLSLYTYFEHGIAKCHISHLHIDLKLGMGIIENSTVQFGSRFCFYGSDLSRFPKRYINDNSWIRNYAMECVAELA